MRRHLSYANIAATLALVLAMSGGALAANSYLINSTKQINPKVLKKLTGKPGKNGKTGAPGATGATGAAGKEGATGKEGAPGKEAANASNALALGGIPASGYTRNDCNSLTGQIKGFALVPEVLSSTFTNVPGAYNCSGQVVQARRIAEGEYEVKFLGSPVTIAVGNVIDNADLSDDAFVSFSAQGPGDFDVSLYNVVLKIHENRPFSIVAP
jgi:hypothetical protein